MSVFNCHVNRAPVSGVLTDYAYTPGKKMAAFAEKASFENEQNLVTLSAGGARVAFKQIAGAIARRIIFYLSQGDSVLRGQRVGIILFGSRVDLFVPDDAEILAVKGQKVKASLSALARWSVGGAAGSPPPPGPRP
jgi:phosphatidylserine decarboxylase